MLALIALETFPRCSHRFELIQTKTRSVILCSLDDEIPSDESFSGSSSIDKNALNRDLSAFQRPPATPQEVASHLPSWAASIMLDQEAQASYASEIAASAAREYNAVEGRTWEDLDYDGDAGLSSFTASEIAEDYSLPVETVLTRLVELGVDIKSESAVDTPIKAFCTSEQLKAMSDFVALTDPIAAREALSDTSVLEISVEGGGDSPLSSDTLVQLCERHDIPLVLGIHTRLNLVDHEALIAIAEAEEAFM